MLTVQIDAAINPGNSGGPVLKNNRLVGVAMQMLESSQNIGYMIPIPIIKHFFDDIKDGKYDGFPMLGIDFDSTENAALKKYYNIGGSEGGILITRVMPYGPCSKYLKKGDIILEINGIPIGEDGTFEFRDNERLLMPYLVSAGQVGEDIDFSIIRQGKRKNISVKLTPFVNAVPFPYHFEKPPYYIYGGLIFTVLTADLLQVWGRSWWENAPLDLNYYLLGSGRLNFRECKEFVVMLNALSDDINVGYQECNNNIITKVNGKEFKSFKEFVLLINRVKNEEEYTVIESEDNTVMILDNANIDEINKKIIKRNNIPFQFSDDVANWLGFSQK